MTTLDRLSTLTDSVGSLDLIGLDQLILLAGLQTRVDRKYLVPAEDVSKVVDELSGDLKALQIDDNRLFRYQSVYFDTLDYHCFRHHLQGRRRRFKIRTRCYLDSGECQLEVKMKGGRSETVKARLPYDSDNAFALTLEGRDFIAGLINNPEIGQSLEPVLMTYYRRATLVDTEAQSRMTCDVELEWLSAKRESGDLVQDVLIETKTQGPAGAADKLLRAYGHRPISISKYCLGVALLNPELRANPWHRTMRRYFGCTDGDPSLDSVPSAS